MTGRKTDFNARADERRTGRISLPLIVSALLAVLFVFPAPAAALQPDQGEIAIGNCWQQDRQIQLREEALKATEQRLNALEKDIGQRITAYENLLAQVQGALKELKATGGTTGRLVAVYAAMPPESAAAAISGLDVDTAVKIMIGMQPRKAAAIMSSMPPAKVVAISSAMLAIGKKIPIK